MAERLQKKNLRHRRQLQGHCLGRTQTHIKKELPEGSEIKHIPPIIYHRKDDLSMEDEVMIKKTIGIVVNDSYDREFNLLRWLFRKYEEAVNKDDKAES